MELHAALAELANDHGQALFSDAHAFRGALDDYLDEGTASRGTINLLADAVGLGALDGMLAMIDSGASAESAVDTAGRRFARDRGSADVLGSQWATALLGYAIGRVPLDLVGRLDPEGTNQQRPESFEVPASAPPGQSSWPQPGEAGQHTRVAQPRNEQTPPPPPPAPPPQQPWSQPAPPRKKSHLGLIIGIVAAVLVLVAAGVVGLVVLSNDDEEPRADEPAGGSTEDTGQDVPTDDPTEYADGTTITGKGYVYNLPDDWIDGTDQIPNNSSTRAIDTVALWGDDLQSARSNIIVEKSSSYGNDDPADLEDQWRNTLEAGINQAGSQDLETTDIDDIEIDGEDAVGVQLEYTNQFNVKIRQIAYLTVHGDQQYSLAVTIIGSDTDSEPIFRDALDSWQWDD